MSTRLIRNAVAPLLVAGGLVLAQPALATDYCVAPKDTCGAGNVQSFQAALDAAAQNAGPDRVFLGATTYTAPSQGYIYDPMNSDDPVEVAGAGQSETILKGTSGAYRTLAVFGGSGTSVHDLSVVMPPSAPDYAQAVRTNGAVQRVVVSDDAVEQGTARTGVFFTGPGSLEDSDVSLNKVQGTTAVETAAGTTVRNAELYAYAGVRSNGGTIDRASIDAEIAGIGLEQGATKVTSSRIYTYGNGSVGIGGEATSGDMSVDVDGVNIIGPSDPTQGTGISVGNVYAPAAKVDVTVKNTIVRGYPYTFWLESAAPGYVHASASYSDYDPTNAANGPTAQLSQSNISNVGSVGFADEDYSPIAGSPLIDAGDPTTAQGVDVQGKALVTDGNGDGVARRDIGAYEFPAQPLKDAPAGGTSAAGDQPPVLPPVAPARDTVAPGLSGVRFSHKVFAVGRARTAIAARTARGTRLSYTLSESAKVVVKIQRVGAKRAAGKLIRTGKGGRNTIAFSGRIGAKALKAGRYRAVITATDAAGNRSAAKSVSFRIVKR